MRDVGKPPSSRNHRLVYGWGKHSTSREETANMVKQQAAAEIDVSKEKSTTTRTRGVDSPRRQRDHGFANWDAGRSWCGICIGDAGSDREGIRRRGGEDRCNLARVRAMTVVGRARILRTNNDSHTTNKGHKTSPSKTSKTKSFINVNTEIEAFQRQCRVQLTARKASGARSWCARRSPCCQTQAPETLPEDLHTMHEKTCQQTTGETHSVAIP